VPADAKTVLLEVRQEELRRVLTARGQIALLAGVAEASRIPTILLKGGLAALTESAAGRFARRGHSPIGWFIRAIRTGAR
jgi:hypothetical protein